MEQIKITDMLTLRQEALRMAVIGMDNNVNANTLVERASVFETYIKGNATIPEYNDPNADKQQWIDMLNKMREDMKPTAWISADSEMRPTFGTKVLAMVSGIKEPMFGRYDETGWIIPSAPSNAELIAYLPIPEFKNPIK